jgi:hypothetical protein
MAMSRRLAAAATSRAEINTPARKSRISLVIGGALSEGLGPFLGTRLIRGPWRRDDQDQSGRRGFVWPKG